MGWRDLATNRELTVASMMQFDVRGAYFAYAVFAFMAFSIASAGVVAWRVAVTALQAKLPEMVVCVEVRPSEPRRL